jgi:hypothetical protein
LGERITAGVPGFLDRVPAFPNSSKAGKILENMRQKPIKESSTKAAQKKKKNLIIKEKYFYPGLHSLEKTYIAFYCLEMCTI